ncbi:hypothetical protein BaRGS_00017017 [Batillaria attramentaria]|uniref:Neurotransmitter-gated ion-channel ligand-binding domain-containing protein n=1 Tax=Batillaria attramentaria TaxID=370345 RepID=A0ABD0KXG0_9CAEN
MYVRVNRPFRITPSVCSTRVGQPGVVIHIGDRRRVIVKRSTMCRTVLSVAVSTLVLSAVFTSVTATAVVVGDNDTDVGVTDEQRLYRRLRMNLDPYTRPVYNASHPVVVKIGITLTQIFDLDEKNQVLTTNVWLDHEWVDEKMRWDPEEFNGLKVLRIPCKHIWKPDIVLYNSRITPTGSSTALANRPPTCLPVSQRPLCVIFLCPSSHDSGRQIKSAVYTCFWQRHGLSSQEFWALESGNSFNKMDEVKNTSTSHFLVYPGVSSHASAAITGNARRLFKQSRPLGKSRVSSKWTFNFFVRLNA